MNVNWSLVATTLNKITCFNCTVSIFCILADFLFWICLPVTEDVFILFNVIIILCILKMLSPLLLGA